MFVANEGPELSIAVEQIGTRAALHVELGRHAKELRPGSRSDRKPEAERSNNDLLRDALPNTAHLGFFLRKIITYKIARKYVFCVLMSSEGGDKSAR